MTKEEIATLRATIKAALAAADEAVLPRDVQEEHDHESVFVRCDKSCLALSRPPMDDLEEVLLALLHWKSHGLYSGCSHGN